MIITLSIFYYLYLVALAIFILYSLFNIYHLVRFGFLSVVNILVIVIYLAVAGALLTFSFALLININWNQPLIDFSGFSFIGQKL